MPGDCGICSTIRKAKRDSLRGRLGVAFDGFLADELFGVPRGGVGVREGLGLQMPIGANAAVANGDVAIDLGNLPEIGRITYDPLDVTLDGRSDG